MTTKATAENSFVEEIARQWRAERPDIADPPLVFQIYLQRIVRLIERRFTAMCAREFGLHTQDVRILLALRRSGRPYAKRPTDLFRALLVTSGAMTKQVDRLVDRGLVRRRRDPDFRGGFLVQLTARGRDTGDRAASLIARDTFMVSAMATLDTRETAAVRKFCLAVLAALEAPGTAPSAPIPPSRRAKRPARRQPNTNSRRPTRR